VIDRIRSVGMPGHILDTLAWSDTVPGCHRGSQGGQPAGPQQSQGSRGTGFGNMRHSVNWSKAQAALSAAHYVLLRLRAPFVPGWHQVFKQLRPPQLRGATQPIKQAHPTPSIPSQLLPDASAAQQHTPSAPLSVTAPFPSFFAPASPLSSLQASDSPDAAAALESLPAPTPGDGRGNRGE
jgi:hypothetical protein